MKVSLRDIKPNPQQPRRDFDKAALTELAESIKSVGLIQPVVVEEIKPGKYFIIDGERRFRACQMIPGLNSIEVVIRDPLPEGDKDRLTQAVVANVQREDLNPMEEARAYKKMAMEHGFSVNQIAIMTGKNIVTINSRIDLMDLDEKTQELIEKRLLPHDRRLCWALISLPINTRLKLVERFTKTNLSIKQMLKIIDKVKGSIPNQSDNRVRAGSKVSSIKLATEEIAFDPKRWNVLQLVGKVPPWEMVEAAAENTCNDCALRDMASETVCKECPAVFFVSRLLRGTE
jgi:ParB family chromosome partitioning protein